MEVSTVSGDLTLSVQIRPWDTPARCRDFKQATNQQRGVTLCVQIKRA